MTFDEFDIDIELEMEYKKMFGHGVPREMIPEAFSEKQIQEAMRQCIRTNTDNIFDVLGIQVDNNYYY